MPLLRVLKRRPRASEICRPFLFLKHQNSMELHKATYTGCISSRDEPAPNMHPDDMHPEMPRDMWEMIALDAGDGKKMRCLAKLVLGFADAARSHEDNIPYRTPCS